MKNNFIKVVAFVLALTVFAGVSGAQAKNQHQQHEFNLDIALNAYSYAMDTKRSQESNSLTMEITRLISERKQFYQRYFQIGLHSQLIDISTAFDSSKAIRLSENLYQIQEVVTLSGKPILQVAEDYPVFKAYLLAAEMTKDGILRFYLESEANEIRAAVQESIDEENFQITIINLHKIRLDSQTGHILSDSFTTKANDDAGFDTVEWRDGKAIRIEPDLTHLPDNEIYNISIGNLAEQILSDLDSADIGDVKTDNNLQYSGSTAATYATTWVRTTKLTPCGSSTFYQDSTAWNSNYTGFPCADCANYVSQAMRYGGTPTDSTWQPYTYAWYNVGGLQNYALNNSLGYFATCSTIGLGDLGFQSLSHVVMVTGLNPMRYSAHSIDRLNYPWQTVLNTCVNLY